MKNDMQESRVTNSPLKWAMYAVLSMEMRINELGEMTAEAPLEPKTGCKFSATSGRNFPSGSL